MFSQKACNVNVAQELLIEIPIKLAIQNNLRQEVESCSNFLEAVIPAPYHAFLAASHMAYDEHRPLILSPDILWLMIAQGTALHVNSDPEKYREKFVNFEGKQDIIVRDDTFIKGALENPWERIFSMFSKEIGKRIGKENHERLVLNFSTTGPVEKAANEVILMDTVKNYFELIFQTRCGIPEVILEGKAEDYALIRDKAKEIGNEYDLNWWMKELLPTLYRIADNIAGKDDPDLWANWYKLDNGSGGPYIGGHIVNFFPYLKGKEGVFNRRSSFPKGGLWNGIQTEDVPSALSSVPFKWEYYTDIFDMSFIAGFVGITQNKETKAVRPKIGWAVMDNNAPKLKDRR